MAEKAGNRGSATLSGRKLSEEGKKAVHTNLHKRQKDTSAPTGNSRALLKLAKPREQRGGGCDGRSPSPQAGSPSYLQRHQSAKPRPQYGSRQMAICREEYSSHWSLTALQRALTAEWDICKARAHGWSWRRAALLSPARPTRSA